MPPAGDRTGGDWRPCVAMLLFDDHGRVLVAERNDMAEAAWQLPQGGIDEGEEPQDAGRRELAEEIGTERVEYMGEASDWIAYDLPPGIPGNPWAGRYRGQKVKLVAFRLTGNEHDIDLATASPEFRAWKWVELEELPSLVVAFKRPLYEAAVREFSPLRDRLRTAK